MQPCGGLLPLGAQIMVVWLAYRIDPGRCRQPEAYIDIPPCQQYVQREAQSFRIHACALQHFECDLYSQMRYTMRLLVSRNMYSILALL